VYVFAYDNQASGGGKEEPEQRQQGTEHSSDGAPVAKEERAPSCLCTLVGSGRCLHYRKIVVVEARFGCFGESGQEPRRENESLKSFMKR